MFLRSSWTQLDQETQVFQVLILEELMFSGPRVGSTFVVIPSQGVLFQELWKKEQG